MIVYYVIMGIVVKSEVILFVIFGEGIIVYIDVIGFNVSLILVVFFGSWVEVSFLFVYVVVCDK